MPPRRPLSLRLTGAAVLRDGEMQERTVAMEGGVISKGPLPEADLSGHLILPGIVDLQSGVLAAALPGRSGPAGALAATDRALARAGVTTAWAVQGWSWAGGVAAPEMAEAVLQALGAYRPSAGIDLRLQLACETHMPGSLDRIVSAVRRHKLDFVTFQNSLPNEAAPGSTAAAARELGGQVPRFLCRLADAFDTLGTLYGSRFDPDAQTREYYSMIGAGICVTPAAPAPAAVARAVGDAVLLPAPALLRARAEPAPLPILRRGQCDALVSADAPGALVAAALMLAKEIGLPAAWALISSRPAEILRLPDRGVIDYGRRADLTILDAASGNVAATIVAGRLVWAAPGLSERLQQAGAPEVVAA
ncbi:alkylphosphonate utilization protein [Pseudoroseicyclus sp. CXY001]|uniref:alkylphosphonate utilization protein n=1 Tax=Pseudoroseicyclus sp. CXY001 TaxID=3242492 RepID=UPI00358DBE9E